MRPFWKYRRFGLALILLSEGEAGFTDLKSRLALTDGNLASHLLILEREDYIGLRKKFIGRKPHTTYFLTLKGHGALKSHIAALKEMLAATA